MPYLLDTNTFIAAKNQYYRFSFCPAYWEWILAAHERGLVFSIDKVKVELTQGNDDLATWAKQDARAIFLGPPAGIETSLSLVSKWAVAQKFSSAAQATFLSSADYFLVAYAHALGYTVVTQEQPDPNSIKRVKIPDACVAVSVPYASTFQMLDDEKALFVMGGASS